MVVPDVLSVIVTDNVGPAYVPDVGDITGAGNVRLMTYAADEIGEVVNPDSVAMACNVSEVETVIGPL